MNRGQHQQQAPRVQIHIAPDESFADVTIEGYTQRVTGHGPKETRRAALDLVTSYARNTDQNVLIEARDANSVWQLMATPAGVVRAVTTAAPAPPRPVAEKPKSSTGRKILFTAVGVVGGLLLLLVVISVLSPSSPEDEPTDVAGEPEIPTVMMDSRPVPPGFTRESPWRLPMAQGSAPAVARDGNVAALVDPEDYVTVITPDGTELWAAESPVPVGEFNGWMQFVRDGDQTRLFISQDQDLWVWPADGGEPDHFELDDDAALNYAGGGLMVRGADEDLRLVDDELVPVSTPGDLSALVYDGSRVLAASAGGEWAWVSGGDEEAVDVEPAEPADTDGVDELITASGEHVIIMWQTEDDDSSLLAVHDAESGDVLATAEVDPSELDEARWTPGEDVAAYGPVVFDLLGGVGHYVEDFAVASAADGAVYGEIDGEPVVVGAEGEPQALQQDTVRPWGLLDGRAVVVANAHLYALIPE